jgi:hypothetical protein
MGPGPKDQFLLHMLLPIMVIPKVNHPDIRRYAILIKIVRFEGTKYLTHRITYQSYYHDILPNMDISHTLYLGINTSKFPFGFAKRLSDDWGIEISIHYILPKRQISLTRRARAARCFMV